MAGLIILFCLALAGCGDGRLRTLSAEPPRAEMPADGFSATEIRTSASATLHVAEGQRFARIEGNRVFATVMPGTAVIEARASGFRPARVFVQTKPIWTDRFSDGTPDFLRLDDPGDVVAFRESFTSIAEAQYLKPKPSPEVTDCSSLVRFAYREAFREHDGPRVAKYEFPWTPLGAKIFVTGGGFAEFADAESLRRWNTHFVSRDTARALPGDLLFFRQDGQKSPFHIMIALDQGAVVYHTGPIGKEAGEMRRLSREELLRHPLPRWRPLPGNTQFLGVYRWNILKQDS